MLFDFFLKKKNKKNNKKSEKKITKKKLKGWKLNTQIPPRINGNKNTIKNFLLKNWTI